MKLIWCNGKAASERQKNTTTPFGAQVVKIKNKKNYVNDLMYFEAEHFLSYTEVYIYQTLCVFAL